VRLVSSGNQFPLEDAAGAAGDTFSAENVRIEKGGAAMPRNISVLEERKISIVDKTSFCRGDGAGIACGKTSVSGAVSQRACVFCGARVVLNPITDAYHIIHGPIGCASYTWDIRGSLTSGADTFRTSFSTDLRETDVIFGGEKKLEAAIDELITKEAAKLIFVYATCIVGVIGDDIEAICRGPRKNTASASSRSRPPAFPARSRRATSWPATPLWSSSPRRRAYPAPAASTSSATSTSPGRCGSSKTT
jgi:hypothetical protein